jgi:hypothetical protein
MRGFYSNINNKIMNLKKNVKLYIVMIAICLGIAFFLNFFRDILAHVLSGQGGWNETKIENTYAFLKILLILLGGDVLGRILYLYRGKKLSEKGEIRLGRNVFLGLLTASILGILGSSWFYSSIPFLSAILFPGSVIAFVASFGLFSGYRLSEVFDGLEAKA